MAILSSVSFTVALGYGIVAPGIPAFARQFGVSTAAAAGVISAFALMRIAGALPAGRLVDRFGEHKTMAAGIAIVAVSSVLAGFSGSFGQLIALRGVGGLGSAMFSVSGQTLLLRSVPAGLRGRASGLYTGGFLLGGISGPAIGGLVAAWSLRAPFFIYGVMLAIPAGIAAVRLHDGSRRAAGRTARGQRPLHEIVWALRNRAYRAAASANLADGFAVMGVRAAIVPLFVRDVLHEPATWTGIGFLVVAALNAATLLPAGRAADTLGRRPVIVVGCLTSGASMVMLALLPGLWGFLAALAVLGLGSGLIDVAPSAMIGDLLSGTKTGQGGSGGQGGTMVASYQMAGDIGTVTGPVAVGFLVDSVSYSAAFFLAAGVLGLAALAGLFAPETRIPDGAPVAIREATVVQSQADRA
ncbi:MAG TPA: MFS transporter [Streptosporangiaceae bacterium]|nr:MFS transporter [Streptosporangiaceae bacterium]